MHTTMTTTTTITTNCKGDYNMDCTKGIDATLNQDRHTRATHCIILTDTVQANINYLVNA